MYTKDFYRITPSDLEQMTEEELKNYLKMLEEDEEHMINYD